jgi:TetR/AcrR family tetracycline transcriptional repressor
MAGRRSRPRSGLTREKILDAAIDFIDEHGLSALSTRRLGAALGVEGMTLYHYVPSKGALLDGMVERLLEQSMAVPPAARDTPWPEAVRERARVLRATLLAHPAMLTVRATRPVNTPAAVRLLENGLAVLRDQGVPLARAMDTLNAVTMFVIGHTLAEAGRTPGHEGTEPGPVGPQVDPADHPHFAEALATGAGLDFEARFELTLDILVNGFATAPFC